MTAKNTKLSRILFTVIGLALLGIWLSELGFSSVFNYLRLLGWNFSFVLLNAFGWYLLYTMAWATYFPKQGTKNPLFRSLLKIKIVGEAINLVAPLGFVVGDPIRLSFIKRLISPVAGCGSIIVDRTIHILATVVVVFIGMLAFFMKAPYLPLGLRIASWVILLLSFFFVIFLIGCQKRGKLAQGLAFLSRIKWIDRRLPDLEAKCREIDVSTNTFFANRPDAFWKALAYHTGGRILGITEIGIILYFFTGNFDLSLSLILATLTTVATMLFSIIPGGIGVLESMYGLVFMLFNTPPEIGISVQIVRRMRALFWVALGMFFVSRSHLSLRSLKAQEELDTVA